MLGPVIIANSTSRGEMGQWGGALIWLHWMQLGTLLRSQQVTRILTFGQKDVRELNVVFQLHNELSGVHIQYLSIPT